jgi:integrase
MDLHNYKKNFERTKTRIIESEDIPEENKEIALNFSNYLLSEKINRYLGDIIKFNFLLKKPFAEANKEDLRKIIAELNNTLLAEQTKKGFKIMLRKLYRFIRGIEEKGVYPEEVKWISINISNSHSKLPEELLTEDEIAQTIQKCRTLRDKAFIASLAESGCRISEIGTMRIKNVAFEEYGARLTVNGKTYAIEVETGSVLKRSAEKIRDKWKFMKQEYDEGFIVVPKRKMVQKYRRIVPAIDSRYLKNKLLRILKKGKKRRI